MDFCMVYQEILCPFCKPIHSPYVSPPGFLPLLFQSWHSHSWILKTKHCFQFFFFFFQLKFYCRVFIFLFCACYYYFFVMCCERFVSKCLGFAFLFKDVKDVIYKLIY